MSEEKTLDPDLQTKRDFYQNPNKTELQYYTDTFMVQWRELIGRDLTLEFAAIYDRKREDLPEHLRQRPIQGWEMDWSAGDLAGSFLVYSSYSFITIISSHLPTIFMLPRLQVRPSTPPTHH